MAERRIIHIESDPVLGRFINTLLTFAGDGVTVTTVPTAAHAKGVIERGLAQEPPVVPDLVISDMDTGESASAGKLIAGYLAERALSGTALLILTGRDEASVAQELGDAPYAYLRKPAQPDTIEGAVVNLLDTANSPSPNA